MRHAALILLVAAGTCHAAKIASVDITNVGPLRLAGDTIAVSVLLEPAEKEVTLKLRAYFANGSSSDEFAPVMAAAGPKDDLGRLLVTRTIKRQSAGLGIESTEFFIDGKHLQLPEGTNQVQYEVLAAVPGAPERNDAAPTAIWPVYIVNGVRMPPGDEGIAVQPARPIKKARDEAWLKKLAKTRVTLPAETNYKRWIYFATNRPQSDQGLQKNFPFRSTHSEQCGEKLSYGVAEMKVPYDIHRKGALELGGWSGKRTQDAFAIKKPVLDYPEPNFFHSLLRDDVLLFVHGFNNSFEAAVLQAAQLRVDVGYQKFQGRVVAFSWPAFGGNVAEYRSDGVRAKRSVPAMVRFVRTLLAKNTERKDGERRMIHLVAHSMGNRVLLAALDEIAGAKTPSQEKKLFGNVFLAAPDVSAGDFPPLVAVAAKSARRVTVYYSKKDLALFASELLHWGRRAGKTPQLGGKPLANVDFICTDNVNTWSNRFGHGYFAGVDRVLTDISMVLHYDLAPAERRALLVPNEEQAGCWAFVSPCVK